MANDNFQGKTTFDGFEWTVKLSDTDEGYLVTATDLTRDAATTTAKTALKQKYLDNSKTVPTWLQ